MNELIPHEKWTQKNKEKDNYIHATYILEETHTKLEREGSQPIDLQSS